MSEHCIEMTQLTAPASCCIVLVLSHLHCNSMTKYDFRSHA